MTVLCGKVDRECEVLLRASRPSVQDVQAVQM